MTTLPVHRLHELPVEITRYLSDASLHRILLLYTAVHADIGSGALPPGRILTYPDLQGLFRPRMSTREVSGALWLLRKDGLVETKTGLGTRVRVERQDSTRPEDWVPQSVRVENALRRRLADGTQPGTRWPSQQALAAEFNVSVSTIHAAQAPLFAEGYLTTSTYRRDGTKTTDLVDRTPLDVLLRPADRPSHPPRTTHAVETLRTAWGESKTLSAWSSDPRCQVSYQVLHARVRKNWPLEKALTTPKAPRSRRSPSRS